MPVYKAAWCHIPLKEAVLVNHCCENLRCHYVCKIESFCWLVEFSDMPQPGSSPLLLNPVPDYLILLKKTYCTQYRCVKYELKFVCINEFTDLCF
jgi:hypothetical protein